MSALTLLWQQLVRKTLHAAGHRCLDGGEIAPGRARLGRDHLDPNNENGRDHDNGNGRRVAHVQPLSQRRTLAFTSPHLTTDRRVQHPTLHDRSAIHVFVVPIGTTSFLRFSVAVARTICGNCVGRSDEFAALR